ncbi:MAG: NAD(P)-dependent oxidoreductase [Candidatus Galacturonibacter soehngenii]|nr:NAD(P)-dependent oxidoreductase [Candidatus Galacturonibacter soehngenii]
MKRAVITGPTGAIGIALIKQLILNNVEILAVCREGSERIQNIPKSDLITVVELDLNQLKRLPDLVKDSYDVFYHFGWDGTFGNSRNNVDGQLDNVKYTLEAVESAAQIGCKTFVGAGSQAEYGRVEGVLNAKTPAFPENGYGIGKLCAGQLSRILCEQKGISHIWTRILSIYGPYDSEKTMIMTTIKSLLQGETPSLTKGEQQWDYLYSMDAGRAMYLLGEKGKHGKIYCIGSGKTNALLEYVEELKNKINPLANLGVGEVPYSPQQVMYLCADIEELTKDTGFVPEYTFDKGIEETIEWYRGRLK